LDTRNGAKEGRKEACHLRAFVADTIDTPITVDGRRRRRRKKLNAQDSIEKGERREKNRIENVVFCI
jgi:hypothetical protein